MVAYLEYSRHRRAGYRPSAALQRARDGAEPLARYATHGWRYGDGWWFDGLDDVPARWVGYADQIARGIDHNGWYADSFQGAVHRGVVYRLTRQRGYLIGYETDSGVYVEYACPCEADTNSDVAYLADGLAERAAERAREWSESWSEGSGARDRLDAALQALRGAIRERVWIALELAGAASLDNAAEDCRRDGIREDLENALDLIDPPRDESLRNAYLDGFGGPMRLARIGQPALVVGG